MRKKDTKNFPKVLEMSLQPKHALLESIEARVDIANHIIAVKNYRRPLDYKDVFKVLEEEKIIPKNLSLKLQEMAKFRNLLVHRYAEVETENFLR